MLESYISFVYHLCIQILHWSGMKEFIKDILKDFVDEVSIEELNHLKFNMGVNEIEEFIQQWVSENAVNYLKNDIVKTQAIPLKKVYNLKVQVIVESESMTADESFG